MCQLYLYFLKKRFKIFEKRNIIIVKTKLHLPVTEQDKANKHTKTDMVNIGLHHCTKLVAVYIGVKKYVVLNHTKSVIS